MTSSPSVGTTTVGFRSPATVACAAEQLVKVYGTGNAQVTAVDGLSVQVAAGTFTAIMGPSGSGKSTLMHCLAGLDRPSAGRILLGDTDLTDLSDRELTKVRRDRIGFVFQAFNLLPALTAEQNIVLPLELAGRRVDRSALDGLVATLGLTDRLRHRPAELSGGQQQRVAVARALITDPDVIFADEPTGALDIRSGHALLATLRAAVREQGRTVVMVTHDPVAASYADRVLLLADGRVAGDLDRPSTDDILATLRPLGA